MSKLYSSEEITGILQKEGFLYISQRGSHAKFRKVAQGKTHTVIVPANKKEIPFGTFRSIVRQAGLRKEDFER